MAARFGATVGAANPPTGQLYTMARAYADIRAGALPWVALGTFMNEWFAYAVDRREALMAEPIQAPIQGGHGHEARLRRWAALCAAAVEHLCAREGISCPMWARDPVYTLAEPWYAFDAPGAHRDDVRAHLRRVTPEPFRRRNIYCGDRVFANKYEFAQRMRRGPREAEGHPEPPPRADAKPDGASSQ